MKQLTALVAIVMMMSSCCSEESVVMEEKTGTKGQYRGKKWETIVIDSCEYLAGWEGYQGGPMLTHKGNCKYCKQRNAQKVE